MPTKIRPIVFKVNEPERFVMNASNATLIQNGGSGNYYVSWEGPAYPSGYNGNGKQYIVVNNNTAEDTTARIPSQLMYCPSAEPGGGPTAIDYTIIQTIGTSTGTLTSNPVPSFGVYLMINVKGTEEEVRAYLANLTITILDP